MPAPTVVRTLNPGLEGTDAGGTTHTFNLAADPVAGQTFVLPLCAYTSGTVVSVSIGGTSATRKTPTTNAYDTTNHTTTEIWVVEGHPGGTNRAVVVTYGSNNAGNGGNFLLCDCITFDGGVVDIGPSLALTQGTSTAPAITSGTLGDPNEVLIGVVNLRNQDATITQPSGWTSLVNVGTWSTTEAGAICYKTVSATTSQTATWTFAPSSQWTCAMVTLKAASSGVTSTIAASQSGLTAAASATETGVSMIAATTASLTGAASASEAIPGTAAATQAGLTASVSALESNIPGANLDASATVTETIPSTVAASQSGLTASVSASQATGSNSIAAVMPGLDGAAAVVETIAGSAAGSQSGLTAAASASESVPSTVAANQSGLTASAAAAETATSSVAGVQPGLVAAASATETGSPITSTIAATMAGLSAQAFQSPQDGTGGRRRSRQRPAIGA